MRNISFALTTEQVRNRTKTVTRLLGWPTLQPGTLLQPVVKTQGLKKGEHVETIGGPIRVVSIHLGALCRMLNTDDPWGYETDEAAREGFPHLSNAEFVEMFCREMRCTADTWVTRIEFSYETTLRPNRFDCPDCGQGVGVDEDGCCRSCGRDATPVPQGRERT